MTAEIQLEKSKYDYWKIPFTQMGDPGNTLSANIVWLLVSTARVNLPSHSKP
jgi:hypothetical protein